MDYRFLGATGLEVSELSLGAMTFGNETDEQTSTKILDTFTEAGGNFIDTADIYGEGRSEEVLGRWLTTRRREDHIVATKVWGPTGPGRNDRGLSRKHILEAVEASLRRLGTDYIDLYQLHLWDAGTPLTETLSTLDMLVRSGKVRYVGASNFCGWQLQKAIDLCRPARLGTTCQPATDLHPARPRGRVGAPARMRERGPWRDHSVAAAVWLAVRGLPARHDRTTAQQQGQ